MVINSDWIQTFTGKQFFPLKPKDIDINDIAHALSMICRFNGHCSRFYSVAEHSLNVSYLLSDELALWGLLHDASEAYFGDICRPIKQCLWYLDNDQTYIPLRIIEDHIAISIATAFKLSWPIPEEIKKADMVMLATEKRDLMTKEPFPWLPMPSPRNEKIISTMTPYEAKELFLSRFDNLSMNN